MFIQKLQGFCCKLLSGLHSTAIKIFATLSIIWMVFIGYIIWWNSISSTGYDKSFKWDEWIWFGVVPAIVPYLFYFIWKKEEENKE